MKRPEIRPMTCCMQMMTSAATKTVQQRTWMKEKTIGLLGWERAIWPWSACRARWPSSCKDVELHPLHQQKVHGLELFFDNMDYAFDWILMVHDALWQELQQCSSSTVSWHAEYLCRTSSDPWKYECWRFDHLDFGQGSWKTSTRKWIWKHRSWHEVSANTAMAWNMFATVTNCKLVRPREGRGIFELWTWALRGRGLSKLQFGGPERNLLTNSHGEIHQCLVKLLELQRVETTMELVRILQKFSKLQTLKNQMEINQWKRKHAKVYRTLHSAV